MGEPFDLSAHHGRWMEPTDESALDLIGLRCLPGLVDAHAHLSADSLDIETVADPDDIVQRGRRAVQGGVSAALDKGWDDDLVLDMVTDGRLTMPRVVAAGRMVRSSDGYWDGFGEVVDGELLPSRVASLASDRSWVKIVADWPRKGRGALPNYGEAALTRAVSEARASGARVAVHTMAPDVPSAAVRAGVDSIEHGLFLTENDLEIMARRGSVWVPTILRMEQVLAEMKPGSSGAELLGRGLENIRRLLPVASELGVDVLTGTDLAVGVAETGLEVQALIRYGYPTKEAVAGASTRAYAHVGLGQGLRVGSPADVIAYRDDPFDNPLVLTDPVLVVFDGRLLLDRR